jgi:hypothetical protein
MFYQQNLVSLVIFIRKAKLSMGTDKKKQQHIIKKQNSNPKCFDLNNLILKRFVSLDTYQK